MWNLYLVEHPIGQFIGVAKSEADARLHWGNRAKITLIEDEREILTMRLKGPERIFLAI